MKSSQVMGRLAGAVLLGGVLAAPATAQPLNRDLNSYFIFAERRVTLKNMKLDTACNVGVNCASAGIAGDCGSMNFEDIDFPKNSQMAADVTRAARDGAKAWQIFSNSGPNLAHVTLGDPPVQSWTLPIIPNSCNAATCSPDVAALQAACGFPNPFPACDGLKPIVVSRSSDCPAGVPDTVPGNQTCDLPPGRYGDVQVRTFGNLALQDGEYQFCSFATGKYVRVRGSNSILDIDGGDMNVSDQTLFGNECGDFRVRLRGTPAVVFGRRATIAAFICAPGGFIRLGDTNTLIGQFIADTVTTDHSNAGRCCSSCPCF